jgi:hypothetical protein
MKKRYDVKSKFHSIYNEYYCQYTVESTILNSGAYTVFWDRNGLNGALVQLIGNDKGQYISTGGTVLQAFVPVVVEQLKVVEQKFKDYCRQKVNSGYSEPTEYPPELLDMKLKLEAKYDILSAEVEMIQKKLREFKDMEAKEDDSRVLQYGLQRSGKFWGSRAPSPELINVLHDLDGQLISMHDGFLIIDDERSPYDGMKVSDYHTLAKQWVQDRLRANNENLNRLQAQAKETGRTVPLSLPVEGPKKVSRASLPAWPEGVVNHKRLVTISRTR